MLSSIHSCILPFVFGTALRAWPDGTLAMTCHDAEEVSCGRWYGREDPWGIMHYSTHKLKVWLHRRQLGQNDQTHL